MFNNDIKDTNMKMTDNFKNIRPERTMSPRELNDAVADAFKKAMKEENSSERNETNEKNTLSDEERIRIKEETGWSDSIINHIENMAQYEIYKNADLHEAEIDGKTCLVKNIDMDYVDPKTGKTNRELLADGRAPINPLTGEKLELHHMGQKYDAPFAELWADSEHGDGNDSILHPNSEESWRNDSRLINHYNNVERPNHWEARSKEV